MRKGFSLLVALSRDLNGMREQAMQIAEEGQPVKKLQLGMSYCTGKSLSLEWGGGRREWQD